MSIDDEIKKTQEKSIEEEEKEQRKKQDESLEQVRMAYQRVFCNPEGKIVLTDILNELYFYSGHVMTDTQKDLSNFARTILWKIGVWEEWNRFMITSAILDLPKSPPKGKKRDIESGRSIIFGKTQPPPT